MTKLYILLAVSVGLAWLYDHSFIQTSYGPKRPRFIYATLVTILICFAGFRGSYNDTWNYRDVYTYLAKGFPEIWETFSWELGENPAFNIIQAWFKTYETDVHLFLMFFAFWTVLLYMAFLKKYSVDFALTIYFFFTMGCYLFNLAAIKQCMATAFCLLAIPYALSKKWGRFLLFVGFGVLFHPYAAMYLIVPIMMFKPWSKPTYCLLAVIIIGGYLFQPLLGTVINITTAIGEEYTESTFTGTGVGMFRVLVCWAPVILSFLFRKVLFHNSTKEENLFVNLSIVFAGIIFVGQFGTALYFGRLSYYFLPASVVSLSWMLTKIKKTDRTVGQLIMGIAIICYFIYFYFSNTVETQFETSYEALKMGEFLEIMFDALEGAH